MSINLKNFLYLLGILKFLKTCPWWLNGKESACHCRRYRFDPWVGMISWRRKCNPLQNSCRESPWTEEAESLQSIGSQRVRLNLATKLQDSSVHLWKYMWFSVLWQRRLFFPFCAPLPTVLVSFSSLSARLPRWPLLTSGLCCIMTKLPGKKGQILS